MEPPDSSEPPQASDGEIRQCGAFLIVIGIPGWYFLRGWYASGIMPAEWVAYLDIFLGLWMLFWPRPWRYRVGKFKLLGSNFQKRPPSGG